MSATKTAKPKQRQSPEEMRAVFRQMADYAETLQRLKELSGIPETERHRYLPWFYDPSIVTSAAILNFYNRKVRRLRPKRRPGRPEGGAKPKHSAKASVSPDLALAVYRAKDRRMDWKKIARTVLNETIPPDLAARERLRARVRYREAVGLRLSRKKK